MFMTTILFNYSFNGAEIRIIYKFGVLIENFQNKFNIYSKYFETLNCMW